jgi:hypothetical protein
MDIFLNITSHIIFPAILIITFWFIAFLFVFNWFRDQFNSYILIGIAWFFLFSSLVSFSLLFSVQAYLSPQFFIMIAAILIYFTWQFMIRKPLLTFAFQTNFKIILAASFVVPSIFLLNNWGNDFAGSSYASLGTLHSAKYAYLSEYMVFCQNLPEIRNNLGQSIVAAFFSTSTGATSTYMLFLVLIFSLFALAFMAYGLFLQHFPQSLASDRMYALVIFIMGSYALSLAVPVINDSGNPLLLVGYSDSLVSIFFFLILIELLNNAKEISIGKKLLLLIPGIATLWVSSPQTLVLIPIAFLYLLFKKSWKNSLVVASAFVVSLVVWRNQSGMLASLSNEIRIPGVIGDESKIGLPNDLSELISPGFPYVVNSLGLKDSPLEIAPKGIDLFKLLFSEVQSVSGIPVIDPARFFWYSEQIFLTTLRPVFWPILGLIFFWLIGNRKRSNSFLQQSSLLKLKLNPAINIIALNFLVTFPLSFLIQFGGRKWEMSRFSFLNWAIGMFFVALLFIGLRVDKRFRIARLIFFCTIVPTCLYLILKVALNSTGSVFSLDTPIGVIGVIHEFVLVNCS